jgi:ribosomal protein S18 acetylase RimI-like enzyme
VRPAGADDRAALLQLWLALIEHHQRLDPHYPRVPGIRDALDRELTRGLHDPACRILIAEDGAALGFLFAEVETSGPGAAGGMSWIHEIYVDDRARRRGIGQALVGRALAFFEERRGGRISVRVETGNGEGLAFWSAIGFEQNALILTRRPSPS